MLAEQLISTGTTVLQKHEIKIYPYQSILYLTFQIERLVGCCCTIYLPDPQMTISDIGISTDFRIGSEPPTNLPDIMKNWER